MSNNPQNAERRITLLYEAYPHEESSDTEEFELERARQELANLSKEFEARALNRERELSETNRTRLLGIAGFIRICISDEEDAAIYKYREEQGWKARDIDDEMVTSLRRGLTLSTKETPPELELPEIELGEYEQLDLYAVVREKIDQKVISEGYGGQLLLLLQKVQTTAQDSSRVIDVARQQAAGKLRYHARMYKPAKDVNPVVGQGLEYIHKLVGSRFNDILSVDSLALEERVKSGDRGEGFKENKRRIETFIAYALDELYPMLDAAERDLDVS